MNFLNTFRGRLLVILAILLIATLGVQYWLNLKTQEENIRLRKQQERALVAGIALGFNGMQEPDARLQEIIKRDNQPFFDERITERIQDIIVIDNNWQIYDTLSGEYLPTTTDGNGNPVPVNLKDIKNLPPLAESKRLGADAAHFPNAVANTDDDSGEAHAIPIKTDQGRWYVMVVLKNEERSALKAAQPLIYTLGVLLASTMITIFLVWRFTRPLANLSDAAKQVADGDLTVRVPDARRADEMGVLALQFNEMTAELEKKKEIEAKLQEAEKSAVVGRLGSAIAHEIRNPLNYINLSLDHLRAKFAPSDEEKRAGFEKLTAQLKTEVARINQQISDFLSYSRPAKANLQSTDIRKVIEDSLRIVEAQAADQNIKISLVERENVPRISGDAEFLRSVFNNLFINAVQATGHNGGSLNVMISPDNNFVKVEIVDTGAGIPAGNLSKIFEPYFSTKETGTGLGLAIVKKVLDVHDGTIDVESRENEGTKFIVRLPSKEI